jgi:hypothetical protein
MSTPHTTPLWMIFSKRYCVALGFAVWCNHSKHWECACSQAHPCALLREGQTRREAGAQSLRASFVLEVAGLPNRAAGLRSSALREGRMRMAAQDHDGGRSPSVNPTKLDHSLDDLARDLATSNVLRGRVLKIMGGALLGSVLAAVPGETWAVDRCPEGKTRCGDRCVNLQTNERHCGSCRNRCASKPDGPSGLAARRLRCSWMQRARWPRRWPQAPRRSWS